MTSRRGGCLRAAFILFTILWLPVLHLTATPLAALAAAIRGPPSSAFACSHENLFCSRVVSLDLMSAFDAFFHSLTRILYYGVYICHLLILSACLHAFCFILVDLSPTNPKAVLYGLLWQEGSRMIAQRAQERGAKHLSGIAVSRWRQVDGTKKMSVNLSGKAVTSQAAGARASRRAASRPCPHIGGVDLGMDP